MAHIHSIYDTDKHFVIDPITRSITTESPKLVLAQGDHKSERYTFEIPRYIEGHDMSECNVVRIHYTNTSDSKSESISDFDEPTDMQVYPEDDQVIVFSWEVTNNATRYDGSLSFSVRLYCMSDDGVVEYSWGTSSFSKIKILKSQENSQLVVEPTSDIITRITNRVLEKIGTGDDLHIIDYETDVPYKLYVVNGKLTMMEVTE